MRLKQVNEVLEHQQFAPKARASWPESMQRLKTWVMMLPPTMPCGEPNKRAAPPRNSVASWKLRVRRWSRWSVKFGRLEEQLLRDTDEVEKQAGILPPGRRKIPPMLPNAAGPGPGRTELFGMQEQENRLRMQVGGAVQQVVQVLKILKQAPDRAERRGETVTRLVSPLKAA